MMHYHVEQDAGYDFGKESYASTYPALHKYPATMIPQIGTKLLEEFGVSDGKLLDPYCGSGSSFASGLECGINNMFGFDINPLAIIISKARFTKVDSDNLYEAKLDLRQQVFDFIKEEDNFEKIKLPDVKNIDFWFSHNVQQNLNVLRHFIERISNKDVRNIFIVPFSETIRECSYTRNNEFKLYKMKPLDILAFNPDVLSIYFKKLNETISYYIHCYLPKLTEKTKIQVYNSSFTPHKDFFDTVLTSPPYGDSRTTVAYGQFSTLSNEWLGISCARKIDAMLMGGQKSNKLYDDGIITGFVSKIARQDKKRALEVSGFYRDLGVSIGDVAQSIKSGGKIFYILGNRTVKGVQLPTDQFVAEQFEKNNCKHIKTIQRVLSRKRMPVKNSPTNKPGATVNTMLTENIVICEKL